VVARLVAAVEKLRPGDNLGPIITVPQFAKVHEYLQLGEAEGARLVAGGMPAADGLSGQLVPPTIFTEVRPDMRIAQEEIFGPVLSVLRFHDEEEALTLANDVSYGLVAGLWTNDLRRAFRLSARLQVGQVFVNEWHASVEVPFGGTKDSGYGREKGMAWRRFYPNGNQRIRARAVGLGAGDTSTAGGTRRAGRAGQCRRHPVTFPSRRFGTRLPAGGPRPRRRGPAGGCRLPGGGL
jgi:acyl-CoA reductase-like NAD-dependent aldehyde dehydrogenase